MRHENYRPQNATQTRRKNALFAPFCAAYNMLLGRTGLSIYSLGRRETLYPKMSRREIGRVADEVCRFAAGNTDA